MRRYTWCCLSFARQYLGHPECFDEELTFERCCLVPEAQQPAERPAVEEPLSPGRFTLGLVGGDLAGRRHLDLGHPLLRGMQTLRGCSTVAWDELFLAVKMKGGCLPCSTPPGDLDRYLSLEESRSCLAGQLFVSLTRFIATPEETVGQQTPEALEIRKSTLAMLDAVEADVRAVSDVAAAGFESHSALFFDVFGVTPVQIRYLLQHTSLLDDYSPIFPYDAVLLPEEERPVVFDLGMSGGMDSLFYLLHGFRVVSVEANPLVALDTQAAMQRFSRRLSIIPAAIISDEERSDMGDPGRMSGFEVAFYIHRNRPDFSALDAKRVPPLVRAGTVPVRAMSCGELVALYGTPFGVKIDAEGADVKCLLSLRQAGVLPRYLSTELANLMKDGAREAFDLVLLLSSMGFTGFKLVRQTPYNARTVIGVDQETNLSSLLVSRQGLGLGASGPFGEAAVDYVAGPRWRGAAEVAAEVGEMGPVWAAMSMGEWFDLHARHR